jgi:HEAT repeat protein
MVFYQHQRDAIRKAAVELEQAEAIYKAALQHYDDLLDGQTESLPLFPAKLPRKVIGKLPDPNSLNQRVLAAIAKSPDPVAVSALMTLLNESKQRIRHAIIYHQKRGVLVHAGLPEQYKLKERMTNVNGAAAVEQS